MGGGDNFGGGVGDGGEIIVAGGGGFDGGGTVPFKFGEGTLGSPFDGDGGEGTARGYYSVLCTRGLPVEFGAIQQLPVSREERESALSA